MNSKADPIFNETLSEKVYQRIKKQILVNRFLPGQVLSIDGLAKDLGVSATPVREAIANLIANGLVERERHKQVRVAAIKEDDVHEAYEVRRLLEPYATALVAKKASTDSALKRTLHDIKQQAEKTEQLAGAAPLTSSQYDKYLDIDLRLHQIILDACGKTLLGSALRMVGNHSLRLRSFSEASSGVPDAEVIQSISREHLAIIEAMLNDTQKEAKRAVREHLHNAEDRTTNAARKQLRDANPEDGGV